MGSRIASPSVRLRSTVPSPAVRSLRAFDLGETVEPETYPWGTWTLDQGKDSSPDQFRVYPDG